MAALAALVARLVAAASLIGSLVMPAVAAPAQYKIVTASERGTYIQIGRDVSKFIAPSADIAVPLRSGPTLIFAPLISWTKLIGASERAMK